MRGYPSGFKPLLLVTLAVLLVTGLLLAPTTFVFRLEWDAPWRLSGSGRVVVTSIHTAISYLILIFLGALCLVHIRTGLKGSTKVKNGLLLLTILLSLPITGIGILYLGEPILADSMAIWHLAVGGLLPVILVCHLVTGTRQVSS